MPSGKNDRFDNLFDLNGDGKTTIDEGFAAFQKMNRAKKQEDDGMPYISPPKPKLLLLCPVRRSAATQPLPNLTSKQKMAKFVPISFPYI